MQKTQEEKKPHTLKNDENGIGEGGRHIKSPVYAEYPQMPGYCGIFLYSGEKECAEPENETEKQAVSRHEKDGLPDKAGTLLPSQAGQKKIHGFGNTEGQEHEKGAEHEHLLERAEYFSPHGPGESDIEDEKAENIEAPAGTDHSDPPGHAALIKHSAPPSPRYTTRGQADGKTPGPRLARGHAAKTTTIR